MSDARELEYLAPKNIRKEIVSYCALFAFILIFSGVLKGIPILKAFDFESMLGSFGIIKGAEGDFLGVGGKGVRIGYATVLTLVPTLMLSMGIVELVGHLGAFDAAGKIFNPIMRGLFGVPGSMAIPLVASLNSSDVSAVTTRDMFNDGAVTDEERTKLIAFQAPGCGLIPNAIIVAGMLTGVVDLTLVEIIGLCLVVKVISSNLMRLILIFTSRSQKAQ